jgi:DNA polymerase-4
MFRVIAHLDMDAFFATVEQHDRPELRGKPVVVGAPPDQRGVVAAASYEARKYGIKTGMTLPEARKLCPGLLEVRGNLDKYVYTSLQMHEIFLEFTDQVEVFSVDECYLDITHLCRQGRDARGVTGDR